MRLRHPMTFLQSEIDVAGKSIAYPNKVNTKIMQSVYSK